MQDRCPSEGNRRAERRRRSRSATGPMSLHSESADWKIYKERTCAGMREFVKKAGTTALQLLYPMATYCVCCGNLIDQSRSYCLCDHCIRRIEWGWLTIDLAAQEAETGRTSDLDSAVACISYGLYGRRLIFDLKYNKHTYTARVIADILADRICSDPDTRHLLRTDFIVPVPLHAKRLAQRGFNQTAKIGKHLERRLRESRIEDLTEKKSLETAAERRDASRADDGITKPGAQLIKLEGWESDVFCVSKNGTLRVSCNGCAARSARRAGRGGGAAGYGTDAGRSPETRGSSEAAALSAPACRRAAARKGHHAAARFVRGGTMRESQQRVCHCACLPVQTRGGAHFALG